MSRATEVVSLLALGRQQKALEVQSTYNEFLTSVYRPSMVWPLPLALALPSTTVFLALVSAALVFCQFFEDTMFPPMSRALGHANSSAWRTPPQAVCRLTSHPSRISASCLHR